MATTYTWRPGRVDRVRAQQACGLEHVDRGKRGASFQLCVRACIKAHLCNRYNKSSFELARKQKTPFVRQGVCAPPNPVSSTSHCATLSPVIAVDPRFGSNNWYQSKVTGRSSAMSFVLYGGGEAGWGSSLTSSCPMLTGDNYTICALKEEAILNAQGLWEVVSPVAMRRSITRRTTRKRRICSGCSPRTS